MNRAILLCVPLLLAGCGGPSTSATPESEAEPSSNVIGEPLERSLDKARSVEELSGQRKGGLDEAIDDAN